MKKTIIALTILVTSSMALGETHIYSTTAKLPNNQLIWPLPSLPEIEEGILVYGKFIESVTILIVNQGNWAEHTYYVRYEVTTPNPEYPHKEISFIVKRGWPTPESGIRVKAMAYPFKGGAKGFILKNDEQVRHIDYFNILSYTQE